MDEAVEIELDEPLNHGQNYVEFTYEGQDFDAIVSFVDEDVVDVEEAIAAAEEAIEALPEYVTEATLEDVKAQIADAKALIAKAQELDENVVFDTYPIEQLEEKISVLEGQMDVDETVNAAQDAIDNLPAVDDVTADNKEAVKAQIAEAKDLVATAEDMDENVVFDTYPLEQAEEAVADFEEGLVTAVAGFETSVETTDQVVELVNDDALREEVSVSHTTAFNKIQQLDAGDEKQALLDRLDVAHNKVIAATSVKGLQS